MALEALAVICQCGFLASTLFTFHGLSCHEEKLLMICPNDTSINVKWAQYGRLRSSTYQCQHFGMSLIEEHEDHKRLRRSRRKVLNSGEDCLASSSLEVVMRACQGKQKCRVAASHRSFKETPCQFSQLEVGYQCLPEFYSKAVSCTGTELILQCPPTLKLLIINATYGYRWPGEAKCQAKIGFDSDCGAHCSPYVVTSRCHGQRSCRIFVDGQTFGDPCRTGTMPYLTVYYACVPSRILNRAMKRKDYPFYHCEQQSTGSDNGYHRPTYLTTPLPTTTYKFILAEGRLFPHWISVGVYVKKNIEKMVLYLTLGAFFGLILLLLVIIAKLMFKGLCRDRTQLIRDARSKRMMEGVSPWRRQILFHGGDETDFEVGRSLETPRPSGPATISAEELPSRLSAPDNESPVFIHVESPRESPVLARNHWNNHSSNGEELSNGRSSSIFRASSLPRQYAHPEQSLLLPREREMALNGKSALSEGQLRSPREIHKEFVPVVSVRSTSAVPHRHPSDLEGDAQLGATPLLVHTFTNPFRNDESLIMRKSSIRRKPDIL